MLGDSVSAGSCASNQYPNLSGRGYVQWLAQWLQASCPDGGSGFQSPTSNNHFSANGAYSDSQLPVHVEGFSHVPYRAGSADAAYFASSVANATLSSYARGTSLSVYYFVGPQLGAFSVSVDGVPLATINCSSGSGGGVTVQTGRTFHLPQPGEHRLLISTLTAAEVDIVAVSGQNEVGVVVDNMSVPGVSLADIAHTNASVVGNPFLSSDGGVFATADLLLIVLGLNDAAIGEPAVDIQAAYRAAITAYQNATVDDLLIVVPPGGDSQYRNRYFDQYRALLPPLAAERGVALIDLNNVTVADWSTLASEGFYAYTPDGGSTPCSYPGLPSLNASTANGVHPSDLGHYNMAALLYPWLATPLYRTSPIVTITHSNSSGRAVTEAAGRVKEDTEASRRAASALTSP